MSLKKDYLGHNKTIDGVGGWKCACCNPFHCSPRRMKPLARRLVRRVNKQALRNADLS